MPEGPEVVITTQYLNTKLRNKKLHKVKIMSGRYTHQKLKGIDLLQKKEYVIKNIYSKGKFIYFELKNKDGDAFIMNTLGMTGRWGFYEDQNSRVKFIIKANNGKTYNLYFTDPLNFGTLTFTNSRTVLDKKLKDIAIDILTSNIDTKQLTRHIVNFMNKSRKDLNLVKILMDQTSIVSGIGNYLVAEILYDAQLSPHRSLPELNRKELVRLADSMRRIVKTAYYENTTGYMKHFKDFMKKHKKRIEKGKYPNYHSDIVCKEAFKFKVYGEKKDPLGNDVQKDEIVKGRMIHWVPAIQK